MKEVTIKIPDKKLNFFIELMSHLGFEVTQKYDIPQEHINIVRDRIKTSDSKPDELKDWDKNDFLSTKGR